MFVGSNNDRGVFFIFPSVLSRHGIRWKEKFVVLILATPSVGELRNKSQVWEQKDLIARESMAQWLEQGLVVRNDPSLIPASSEWFSCWSVCLSIYLLVNMFVSMFVLVLSVNFFVVLVHSKNFSSKKNEQQQIAFRYSFKDRFVCHEIGWWVSDVTWRQKTEPNLTSKKATSFITTSVA